MSKAPKPAPDYTRATIAGIRKQAKTKLGASSVRHIYPRAYCVAKPAPLCGVFAVPAHDGEPQLRRLKQSVSIHNGSVAGVNVGDWCSIAYVVIGTTGENHVIFNLS